MPVTFTPKELQQLLDLLDFATKAGGLNIAQVAMPLAIKINAAIVPPQPEDVAP